MAVARRLDAFGRRFLGPAGAGLFGIGLGASVVGVVLLGEDRTDGERPVYAISQAVTPGANRATACFYALPASVPNSADVEIVGLWISAPSNGNFGVGLNSNFFPQRGVLASTVRSQFSPVDTGSLAAPPAPAFPPEIVEFGDSAALGGLGILAEFDVAANSTLRVPLPPFVMLRGDVLCFQRIDAGSARFGVAWRRLETEPPQ